MHIVLKANRPDLLGSSDDQKVAVQTLIGAAHDFNMILVGQSYNP